MSLALPVAVCIMKGFKDIRREINAHILKLHNIELRREKARAGREMWAITKVRIKQVSLFMDIVMCQVIFGKFIYTRTTELQPRSN